MGVVEKIILFVVLIIWIYGLYKNYLKRNATNSAAHVHSSDNHQGQWVFNIYLYWCEIHLNVCWIILIYKFNLPLLYLENCSAQCRKKYQSK